MRDPEEVWQLGLRLYDAGMAGAAMPGRPAAVLEQAARLRALAATATPAIAAELRELAGALEEEVRQDAPPPLAEAEALVGAVWADDGWASADEMARREERALERLAALRRADPDHERPLAVLAEWVRLHSRRRQAGPLAKS